MRSIPDKELERFYEYQNYYFNTLESALEYDSLIVIPNLKLIINIEVKRGNTLNVLQNAANQTQKHLLFFKKVFGSLLSVGWKFTKAACVPNLEIAKNNNEICKYCKQFFIDDANLMDIESWLHKIQGHCLQYEEKDYSEEYENLLVGLIGYSSLRQSQQLNKLLLDPLDFSKQTECKLIANNQGISGESEIDREELKRSIRNEQPEMTYLCYMLTSEQLAAVKCSSSFIIIDGDYGCGKTYVLKEKAKQCANENPSNNIIYINLSPLEYDNLESQETIRVNTVMDLIAVTEFREFETVVVVTWKDLYTYFLNSFGHVDTEINVYDVIIYYLEHQQFDHVFIDELPPIREHEELPCLFRQGKTFCVTMKCDISGTDNLNEDWLIQMEKEYNAKRIHLTYNMRNSENVTNISRAIGDRKEGDLKCCVMPEKNITGPICYWYNNEYDLDISFLSIAVLEKYFSSDPQESIVILLDRGFDDLVFKYIHKYLSIGRNIVCLHKNSNQNELEIEDARNFLQDPKGILVTDIETFGGAQARNTIIFLSWKGHYNAYLRNIILRTMSFCVVITSDTEVRPMYGMIQDHNLHDHVKNLWNPLNCYWIKSESQIYQKFFAISLLSKYLQDYKQKNVVIITNEYESTSKELEKLSLAVGNIFKFHDSNFKSIKTQINLFLEQPGSILIGPHLLEYPHSLDVIDNIIVFMRDESELSEFHTKGCRNLLLRARPKTVILVGKENIDLFRPFVNLVEDNEMQEIINQE